MCHLYPYNNVKLLRKFFYINLQIDVISPLLLNASQLLVLTTDYSDWLVQVTELLDKWQMTESFEFWWFVLLNNIELID